MPPRKTVRKPAPKKRRSTAKKQAQLPAGLLFSILVIVVVAGFIFLRLSGQESEPKNETKPATQEQQVKKKPVQEEKLLTSPPMDTVKKEPEIVTVEKRVEVISAPNAVKLFMFDRGLKQDSISTEGNTLTLEIESDKSANELMPALADYLTANGLEVTSKQPLKVRDPHGEYTVLYKILPAPVVKKEEPKKEPAKTDQKPQKTVKKQPEKSANTVKAVKPVSKPIKYTAKLAVVIDDCGFSIPLAEKLAAMKYPATFAVIPYTPYGRETAKIARKSGNVLFIHFPMQPKSYPDFDPGRGALFLNMPEALIESVTRANFDYFGMPLDGANNHTGSAFTENEEKMVQALNAISQHTNRFLDSYTSANSKAYEVCTRLGMKCAVNSTFLDNEEPGLVTKTDKVNHVRVQLVHAARKALSKGSSIAIGHLRPDTVAALPEALGEIEKMGVRIVPVTELMN